MPSNLGGGQHRHLGMTMTNEYYGAKMGFVFVPPHNPGDYRPNMVNSQDQAFGTETFQTNQGLFRKYTAVDRYLKKNIMAVELVLLSSLVDQLT